MKLRIVATLIASACLVTATQAKMPAAKSANLVSSFGNAPLNEAQLQALNEVLAVSDPVPVAKPVAPLTPPKPAPKPSKLKPAPNKKEPEKSNERAIDVTDETDKTFSLTIDASAGTFTNLKVPATQLPKVKALLATLNLAAGKR